MNWHKLEKRFFELFGIKAKDCKYYRHDEQCCNSEYCWNGMCIAGISGKERLPISNLILKIRSKIQIWLYKRSK